MRCWLDWWPGMFFPILVCVPSGGDSGSSGNPTEDPSYD